MNTSRTINHTTLISCILSLASIYLRKNLNKERRSRFLSSVPGHATILQHSSFVLQYRWAAFFTSPAHPSSSPPQSSVRGRLWGGPVKHAWALSFMSDTELSHCEQSVLGSMLTNELSPASLEKSFQKETCAAGSLRLKILFFCIIRQHRFLTEMLRIKPFWRDPRIWEPLSRGNGSQICPRCSAGRINPQQLRCSSFQKCGNCKICCKPTVSMQLYVTAAYYINMTYVVILSHYAGGSRSFTIRQGEKNNIPWFWEKSSQKCHINTLNDSHIALILLLVPHLLP